MDAGRSERDKGSGEIGSPRQEVLDAPASRSVPIASKGLSSTRDVKRFAFAVAEDVIRGAVAPKLGSAAISAVSAGLRVLQLEMRHAEHLRPSNDGGLALLDGPKPATEEDQEIAALEKMLAEKKAARAKMVDETPGTARVA